MPSTGKDCYIWCVQPFVVIHAEVYTHTCRAGLSFVVNMQDTFPLAPAMHLAASSAPDEATLQARPTPQLVDVTWKPCSFFLPSQLCSSVARAVC